MPKRGIKVIRLPGFFKKRQFSSGPNCCLIPPLGLGLISAHLRSKDMPVEQADLNIEIHHNNYYSDSAADKIDTEVFFDLPRVERYALGGSDQYIDSIMDRAAGKAGVGQGQFMLLSLPDNIENETNLSFALAFTRFIKDRYGTINILGGQGPWLGHMRSRYGCRNIDHILRGDGEYLLDRIFDAPEAGPAFSGGPYLSVEDGGKVITSNKICRPIKPDFSGLPMDKYRSRQEVLEHPRELGGLMDEFQKNGALLLPYRFIRGCPFECIFCVSSTQSLSHALSPAEIAGHLESMQEQYRPDGFFFLNDTINISRKFINELCDEILNRGLKVLWSDCARADNLDRDTLFKMRRAGCIRLIFGMETASPRLLKYINKRVDLAQLENVLRWSDEAGIWTGVEVICGFPHEREEDIRATISFLNKNEEYINRVYLNHFDLRQGSMLYDSPRKYGLKRVIEVNQCTQRDFSSYVQFGFDEDGGLAWEEKERQMERSLGMVRDSCARGSRFFTDEHLLFFLYSRFSDKERIRSIYLKILKQEG
ncbi:MAG: radical SAM protein [Candidatus Omnitrophica bacterium]|nr:radical SAM protein [Candidatus Omnitrophota bacterium]